MHKDRQQTEVQDLVTRASRGETAALPALQQLLDTLGPCLIDQVRDLGQQTEGAWLSALCGNDLAAQEVLVRQLLAMKTSLVGAQDGPLEALLIERVAVTWVGVQHAEMQLARHLRQSSPPHEDRLQQRVDRASRRFLAAVKTLAQIRKLGPKTAIQVNIGKLA